MKRLPIKRILSRAGAADLKQIIGRLGPETGRNFEHAKSIGSVCYVAVHGGGVGGLQSLQDLAP